MVSPSQRTGTAQLPLHGGKAPSWLFQRMVRLGGEIVRVMVEEYGPEEVLCRLSDPYWFQALGCVLGFDWHSSGVTTTVLGALKDGLKERQGELGLYIAGGKGRASRRTPEELVLWADKVGLDGERFAYLSRATAKVDNTAVQDGYQLYHHVFLFTTSGAWGVVQQGMNGGNGYARRYHWLGERVADLVDEPHAAIASQSRGETLNFVAHESAPARSAIVETVREVKPETLLQEMGRLPALRMPRRHHLTSEDVDPRRMAKLLPQLHERSPQGFEELLVLRGVGPKALRALGLIAELLHGTAVSTRDPARFSFAHGGKDGHPFPVDRETYEASIRFLEAALSRIHAEGKEKGEALRRLARLAQPAHQPTGPLSLSGREERTLF